MFSNDAGDGVYGELGCTTLFVGGLEYQDNGDGILRRV